MRNLFLSVMTAVTAILIAASSCPATAATLPDGDPAIQFKSKRGARSTESDRYLRVYLKSAVAGKTFYLAIDEDTVVEYSMTKAATLYSYKLTLDKEEVTVRIYGDSISFINFNTMDAYDVVVGEDGKNTIEELRCQNDSITSLDFINDMRALTYIYAGNNNQLTEVNIKSDVLERCVLNSQETVESITVEGSKIYEFDFTDNEAVDSIDLSNCPALETVTMTSCTALKSLKLGTHEALNKVQLTYSLVDTLVFQNFPALKTLTLNYNSNLKSIEVTNCPALVYLYLTDTGFDSLSLSNLPALLTLRVNGAPLQSLDLDLETLSLFYCDETPLTSLDLSGLPALKTLYARYGVLESITLSETAYANTLTYMYLAENNLPLSEIPPRGPKMSTSTNYYAPQNPIDLGTDVSVGQKIDLSKYSYGRIYGTDSVTASSFSFITKFEEDLVAGTDYQITDGVVTFLKTCEDSVQLVVTNETYDWFKLYTSSGTTYDYRLVSKYFVINEATTGITSVETPAAAVVTARGARQVAVKNAQGEAITVYDISGRTVARASGCDDNTTITLPASGVYIVAVGNSRHKVLVR